MSKSGASIKWSGILIIALLLPQAAQARRVWRCQSVCATFSEGREPQYLGKASKWNETRKEAWRDLARQCALLARLENRSSGRPARWITSRSEFTWECDYTPAPDIRGVHSSCRKAYVQELLPAGRRDTGVCVASQVDEDWTPPYEAPEGEALPWG